jgi:hypothetical protein
MNIQSQSHKVQLMLKKHQVVTLNEAQPKMAIECASGVIWVTHAGDRKDYVLKAGRSCMPNGNGNLIIEAIADSRVDIEEQ